MSRHETPPLESEKTSFPLANKSERQCLDCGLVKVSRHEYGAGSIHGTHWTEFWRGLDRIECKGTPACEFSAASKEQVTA